MNARQQRLVRFVRELHRRDRRGPEAFLIAERPGDGIDAACREPQRMLALKRAEAANRGERASGAAIRLLDRPNAAKRAPAPSLTPRGAAAFDRVLNNRPLSDTDLMHLECIVLPALRPVFDIQNETFETLPGDWAAFNAVRAQIEPIIRGIGRLQLTGHPSYTLVGTGFACGTRAILTNRHVAQIFVQAAQNGQALAFLPGVGCNLEMLAEVGSAASLLLDVTQPLVVSDRWDLALLRVESLPAGVAPVPLAGVPPAAIDGGVATIVGYPSFDPYESFVDQATIFRSVFDRKRLQPGRLNGRADTPSFGRTVSALAHDCSTLGGNSGSALIAADTKQVVGIHFAGVTHQSNYAIPTWELAADPALAGQALNFV